MGKSNHFLGQPSCGHLIKSLDKSKITEHERNEGLSLPILMVYSPEMVTMSFRAPPKLRNSQR